MNRSTERPCGLTSGRLNTPHLMMNRENGNSPHPYSSLNVSFGVGDTRDNVSRNRRRIKEMLEIDHLISANQVHADKVHAVHAINEDAEIDGVDALITSQRGIGLLIQQADCQAILLHDPDRQVIGAIHCGWRGSALNIIGKTVARMQEEYRTEPASLRAAISPSIGPCCAEFIHYRREFPYHFRTFQVKPDYFDFWAISRKQLIAAGVAEANIDIMKICTVCDRKYFSYRRAQKKGHPATGRQGSVILLSHDHQRLNN